MTDIATEIPTWHHPHFISVEHHSYGGATYQFKPFSGDEPKPEVPAEVEETFNALTRAHPWDSDTGRAARDSSRAAYQECRVANTLWQAARHARHVVGLLKQIAPLLAAYQQAKKAAVEAYEELHGTPDGFWQAKLLAITELRQTALGAARQLDRESSALMRADDGLPERVLEEIPPLRELEKAAGVDLGDWYPQESYGFGCGPDEQSLKELFAEQDERISQVSRLFTGDNR